MPSRFRTVNSYSARGQMQGYSTKNSQAVLDTIASFEAADPTGQLAIYRNLVSIYRLLCLTPTTGSFLHNSSAQLQQLSFSGPPNCLSPPSISGP